MHRIETGRTGCTPADAAALLSLYDLRDEADRETLLELAARTDTPGWWESFGDAVPPRTRLLLGLEPAADVIRTLDARFVPALLQTAEYARAAIRLALPRAPAARIERLVELRMHRGRVLHRPDPPRLWAVVEEAVLRRAVGGAPVMRAQIDHLVEMSTLPHVTVQMLPFEADGRRTTDSSVTILRLPGGELPDVVCTEPVTGGVRPDTPEGVEQYWHVLNRLAAEAESPAATRTLLRWVRDEL